MVQVTVCQLWVPLSSRFKPCIQVISHTDKVMQLRKTASIDPAIAVGSGIGGLVFGVLLGLLVPFCVMRWRARREPTHPRDPPKRQPSGSSTAPMLTGTERTQAQQQSASSRLQNRYVRYSYSFPCIANRDREVFLVVGVSTVSLPSRMQIPRGHEALLWVLKVYMIRSTKMCRPFRLRIHSHLEPLLSPSAGPNPHYLCIPCTLDPSPNLHPPLSLLRHPLLLTVATRRLFLPKYPNSISLRVLPFY